ncbi:ABC transporter permease [Paenibacillus sp. 1P07SE]|uniref:ABC transporter permease n=1 Tax=Paenibacillus sp. 1P07SE TaxID=3132209 RepID=UPI0039A63A03
MFDFMQLVNNENMKIYRRPRTWIMLGLLLVITLSIPVLMYLYSGDMKPSMWLAVQIQSMMAIMMVTVFTVVIAAETVAGEFSSGTIKLLMIRPWSRSKILLSKYIAMLLFGLLFMVVLFGWNILSSMILFGYDGEELMGNRSSIAYWTMNYFYEYVSLIIVVTLAFLISTVFRSGGLAIGLSLFLLLGGSVITGIISMLDYEWVNYLLFANLSLTDYLVSDVSQTTGKPMAFTLGVLGAYYVLFIAVTWLVFSKRDIA